MPVLDERGPGVPASPLPQDPVLREGPPAEPAPVAVVAYLERGQHRVVDRAAHP